MTHQLGSGNAGQDALDERPVRPGRVQRLEVEKLLTIDVDAAEIETRGRSLVEATMKGREHRLASLVDRAVGERDEVKVADAR